MRHRTLAALVALAATPSSALADPPPRGHVLIPTIEIRGRLPKPLAAVEIARAKPAIGARAATPGLTEKIAAAVDGAPF